MGDNLGEYKVATVGLGVVLLFLWPEVAIIHDYFYPNPQRNEPKLEKNLLEEFRIQKSQIDSTYNTKRDSLKGWYEVKIDSLKKAYQTKKDLESSTQ